MNRPSLAFLAILILISPIFSACSSSDSPGADGDTDADAAENPKEDGDLDGEGDGDAEMDATPDGDGDPDPDEEASASILDNPHDGRLYAAAGFRIITPTDENHPCTKLMGGTSSNRLNTGTHDDLEARGLVLQRDDEHLVLVALDLVGWSIADVDKVWDALEPYGIDPERVIVTSTHTHEGPDTMGVWGPKLNESGRCEAYAQFLMETIVDLVVDLSDQMVPVSLEAAETSIHEDSVEDTPLQEDTRLPKVVHNRVTVARLFDDDNATVASLVNWHSHPEIMIDMEDYSADHPRWTRKKMDETLGGTCIYLTGTCGGLATSFLGDIPARDADGLPVLEGGEPVILHENTPQKMWSLGYIVAEYALTALAENAVPAGSELRIDREVMELPFENSLFIMASMIGVIPEYDALITDNPDKCGAYGCIPQPIHHIQVGPFHMVTLPGEAFAETAIGRDAYTHDYGAEYGAHTYPAVEGYHSALPEGHLLMDLGLANNEIGYILPEGDYQEDGHPEYYEEYFSLSHKTEALLRETVRGLLERSATEENRRSPQ